MAPPAAPYDSLPAALRPAWEAALARQRVWRMGCGGAVALAALAFVGYLTWYVLRRASYSAGPISVHSDEILPGLIGVLVALGAVGFVAFAALARGDALRRPARVVWVYKGVDGSSAVVVIAMDDGIRARIPYMVAKIPDLYTADERLKEDEVLRSVEDAYPGALVGFSREVELRYLRNPRSIGGSRR